MSVALHGPARWQATPALEGLLGRTLPARLQTIGKHHRYRSRFTLGRDPVALASLAASADDARDPARSSRTGGKTLVVGIDHTSTELDLDHALWESGERSVELMSGAEVDRSGVEPLATVPQPRDRSPRPQEPRGDQAKP